MKSLITPKEVGDILLQKIKICSDVKWRGHVIHPIIIDDYYSVEVDGGLTIIPEMGKSYHCYNVASVQGQENTYIFQGPEDQGFDEEDVIWTTIEGSDYREQTLVREPGNKFTVDTGFYGRVKFRVISLADFINLPEPEPEPEPDKEPATHVYAVRENVDGSVNIFVKSVDGLRVACITCTSGLPTRTDTWKKVFTEYATGITTWDQASLLNALTKSDDFQGIYFHGSQIGDNAGLDPGLYRRWRQVSLTEFMATNYSVSVWEQACSVPTTNVGYMTWGQQAPNPFIVPCF